MASKQATATASGKGSLERRVNNTAYGFIVPFFAVFLTFNIYPIFRTLYLSFTDFKGFGEPVGVGLANYQRVFQDTIFWQAFGNTLKIWGLNIVIQLGLALLLTILFNDMKYRMKGMGLFRALFYLPNLIAVTSVAFLFRTLLDWKFGTFNQILVKLGILDVGFNWLGTGYTAQIWVAIIGAWMWFGNSFIMLMAGVQGIPYDYYEAATIDGAGRWTIFAKITMPLLRPIMLYVAVTSLIGGLQLFELPMLMSAEGNGEPGRALNTAVLHLYNMAFRNHQMGYAAAIAYVLFAIIAVGSFFAFRIINGKKEA